MTDSTIQRQIEAWIRDTWLKQKFRQQFQESDLHLTSGGKYKFNAVSADGTIIASISTSKATTASGNEASGKITKIRADMYFLLLAKAKLRLVVLTEKDMYSRCMREVENGRVPSEIEFVHVELPQSLKDELAKAQKAASDEVSPR